MYESYESTFIRFKQFCMKNLDLSMLYLRESMECPTVTTAIVDEDIFIIENFFKEEILFYQEYISKSLKNQKMEIKDFLLQKNLQYKEEKMNDVDRFSVIENKFYNLQENCKLMFEKLIGNASIDFSQKMEFKKLFTDYGLLSDYQSTIYDDIERKQCAVPNQIKEIEKKINRQSEYKLPANTVVSDSHLNWKESPESIVLSINKSNTNIVSPDLGREGMRENLNSEFETSVEFKLEEILDSDAKTLETVCEVASLRFLLSQRDEENKCLREEIDKLKSLLSSSMVPTCTHISKGEVYDGNCHQNNTNKTKLVVTMDESNTSLGKKDGRELNRSEENREKLRRRSHTGTGIYSFIMNYKVKEQNDISSLSKLQQSTSTYAWSKLHSELNSRNVSRAQDIGDNHYMNNL